MDEDDLHAAFQAGFALARNGRAYAEVAPISRRMAEAAFRRWYDQYGAADC